MRCSERETKEGEREGRNAKHKRKTWKLDPGKEKKNR